MIIKKERIPEIILAVVFVAIGASMRLLPHAPNFAPIAAIALFGGVYFSRKIGLVLPIAAMLVSDLFIGFYSPWLMLTVYASFVLTVVLGHWLKKHKKWYAFAGSAIAAGVLFFVVTNFAVWLTSPWYAKTLAGLIQCYVMAIPFFRNTIMGNLFYVTVFFGAYELIVFYWRKKAQELGWVTAVR